MNTIIYTPEEEIKLKKELKELIDNNVKHYCKLLKGNKFKHLLIFINKMTPKLTDPFYTLQTKCYWVLNDLTDFPKCQHCEKPMTGNVIGINFGYHKTCSIKCMANSASVRNKIKETCLEKYGVESGLQNNLIKEKVKQTCLKKYGVENPNKCKTVRNKIKETCLEKYGVEHANQSKVVRIKTKQTCLERYGVENPNQLAHIKLKKKQTYLKKYGVEHVLQFHDFATKMHKRYKYNDINFDSAPELALYIYLKDHNVNFEYQPKSEFWYTHNNKKHKYMPDFKIGDEYVEIKGSQFLDKETGRWINPWNKGKSDFKLEAKHQCCLNNNVKILYTEDYQKYLSYINEKYGKTYLQQFKNI